MSMHKIPLTGLEQSGLEKHCLPTDKPSQLSDCFRLGVQHATQNFNENVVQLCKEKNALQVKIDQLMLEFCPEEMTQEQIENWEQHQVVSTHCTKEDIENSVRCSLELDGNKCTDSQWEQIKNASKFLTFKVCHICGNKRCPKTTNFLFKCTNSNEVGQVGEIDSNLFNYDKLIITTGDDVSKVVWTGEKLEELQRVVDKIKKEEQSSKQCCEGGPQWGHAWDCPKCPD